MFRAKARTTFNAAKSLVDEVPFANYRRLTQQGWVDDLTLLPQRPNPVG